MTETYFTLSKSKVLEQYNAVNQVADIVTYSSKTNPLVTPLLEENTNSFFSMHLENELVHVKDKSRVIFLAQGLDKELLDRLFTQGIEKITVDNNADLQLLMSYLEQSDKKITLYLRMKLKEHSLKTERYFVFGMNSEAVNQYIRELWGHENIASLGIHVHRKTQNMAEWNYERELQDLIDQDVMEIIDYLNIGGGLPSEYANTNMAVLPSIFKKLASLQTYLNKKAIKLIIEPGRFIAAPAGKLHTTIKLIYENNIIVSASVYNSDLDALIVPVKLKVESELPKEQGEAYIIKGKTPCSMDLFRYKVYLDNPRVGDTLVFHNAGAYNFTTNFCDIEQINTRIEE